jgi:hypothetical protein
LIRQAGPARSATHLCPACHLAGGELDQIQFLLGHVSIQTIQRDLACKQKLRHAVNDRMGIEPDAAFPNRGGRVDPDRQIRLRDFSLLISPAQNLPAQAVSGSQRYAQLISLSGLPGTGKTIVASRAAGH